MATEVMSVSPTPDSQRLYQSPGLRRSYQSTGSLYIGTPPLASSPKNTSHIQLVEQADSATSSPPLSSASDETETSTVDIPFLDTSFGTPVTSASSLESDTSHDEDISFPDYGGVQFYHQPQSLEEQSVEDSGDEPAASVTTDTTASDSPLPTPTVSDDSAIQQQPKQHVDYLSHDWREEDIWSSWRHIVSQRKHFGQRSRLENASWRTWAKSKFHLRTISPETLNWLKESDVTWLYGPLKPAESHPITSHQSEPSSQISKSNSFVHKKPILKKRSVSEVMLQKSLSTSSLLQQAAASVQAQQSRQPRITSVFQRAHSDFTTSGLNSEAPSRDQVDYFTSRSSSPGTGTPCECLAKRHIRFEDKVEEVRAIEYKDDPVEDPESEEEDEHHPHDPSEDSSSDDGVIMMKRKKVRSEKQLQQKKDGTGSRSGSHNGRKMIEKLPPSTLKYRTDSPDVSEAQQHHTFGKNWTAGKLSPSPSTETLRPKDPSNNFLISDDQDTTDANSSTWSFGASNPKSSLGSASSSDEEAVFTKRGKRKEKARSTTPTPDAYSAEGLRRTNSGMLMPYDEDEEDEMMAVGLFGRVSETINTAKDIAHVIWNVGWRK